MPQETVWFRCPSCPNASQECGSQADAPQGEWFWWHSGSNTPLPSEALTADFNFVDFDWFFYPDSTGGPLLESPPERFVH